MEKMHSNNKVNKILDNISSQKALIAVRLLLNGVWNNEMNNVRIENFDGRILDIDRGKRQRKVVVDPTTSQLIKFVCKGKRKGRIAISSGRLCMTLSEVCLKCHIHLPQPSTQLFNYFVNKSIEVGRNAASVYAQAGLKKRFAGVVIPTVEERMEDFDSKPII